MNDIVLAGEYRPVPVSARHQHDSWELFYCTRGVGILRFDKQDLSYHAGDMVVIPPEVPHSHPIGEGADCLVLGMTNTTLPLHAPMLLQDDGHAPLHHLLRDAAHYFQGTSEYRAILLPAYGQLISQHISCRCVASPRSQLVEEIVQSILHNYANPNYELDELLRSAPYCYDYLCRLFRQELSTTPHKYLTELRLQSAASALRAGNASIIEVARLSGYHDPLYFSRMFKKKYGVSPREYAKGTST